MSKTGLPFTLAGLFSLGALSLSLQAAGPLSCSVAAPPRTPPIRSEGFTERVGDLRITCTGGTPVALGDALPQWNITLSANVTVTSRLLPPASGNAPTAAEVLLLADDPGTAPPGAAPFGNAAPISVCPTPATGCAQFASAAGGKPVATDTAQGANATRNGRNTFQGIITGNTVTFTGVPQLNSLDGGVHTYRVTNLRVNAAQLGSDTPATVLVTASGVPAGTLAAGAALNLASTIRGLDTPAFEASAPVCASRAPLGLLKFPERYASAFQTRVEAQTETLYAGQTSGATQNVATQSYNSESGLVVSIDSGNAQVAGLADYGTRLKATFSNVPAGMRLFVSISNVLNSSTGAPAPAVIGGANANRLNSGYAQLVSSEAAPGRAFQFPTDMIGTVPITEIPLVGGSGTAVWEVVNTNPAIVETFQFALYGTFSSGFPPATSAGMLSLGLAPSPPNFFSPVSGAAASRTLSIPRFQSTDTQFAIGALPACPVVISCGSAGPARVGTPYANSCTATFGTPPYSWSVSSGSLPAGIALSDTTGRTTTVRGTPTSAALGNYSYSISLTDSSVPAQTASKAFSGTIAEKITTDLPGSAKNIAVGANGSVYITGTTECDINGCPPYKWNGSTFDRIAGSGGHVAVDSAGRLLLLNLKGGLYRYLSPTSQDSLQIYDQGQDVAAGGNALYVVGCSPDCRPYRYNGNTFEPMNGAATRIAADSAGRSWTVDFTGAIYRYKTADTNSDREIIAGANASSVATSPDGVTYAILTTPCDVNGCTVAKFNGNTFDLIPGLTAKEIAADRNGVLWLITTDGNVHRYPADAAPAPPTVSCLPVAGPTTVGAAYTSKCTASNGMAPLTWSISPGTLPDGLTLGDIAGPTASVTGAARNAGAYDYTVSITDALNRTAGQRFTGNVASSTKVTVACRTGAGPNTLGASYSETCGVTGGIAPYRWTVSAGSLPAGLSLSGATTPNVTVSGVPTALGAYRFTLQATDSSIPPQSDTQTLQGTVSDRVILSCTPATGPVSPSSSYTITCTASNGTPDYNFSVTGLLPIGMSTSSPSANTFVISGIPGPGDYNFTVSVTDNRGIGNTASQTFTGSVIGPISLVCQPSGSPYPGPTSVGTPYSATCTVFGGKPPFQWVISAGALPAGIQLTPGPDRTATVSGTPTASGSYSFTVTVRDSQSPALSASQIFQQILSTGVAISCASDDGPAALGVLYSMVCTAINGSLGPNTTFVWSNTGSLPASLRYIVNDASVTITGIPTRAGPYSYGLVVRDGGNNVTVTKNFTGTVRDRVTVSCSLLPGPSQIGAPYTSTCTAAGGTPPYKWAITSGTLPPGLTLTGSTDTATISGIPTAPGAFAYSVGVSDSPSPVQFAVQPFAGTVGSTPVRPFNAASFVEGLLAPDSLGSVFGAGLAARTEDFGGRVVTTLGGATLRITDSKGVTRDAQLFFAADSQINFLIPAATALGPVTITITKQGSAVSQTCAAIVSDLSPGIFVTSGGSTVPAAFYLRVLANGTRIQDYTFNGQGQAATIPRVSGDALYLLLYGTGFRRVSRATATINGQNIPVLGAVAQPQFAGVDQINIGPLPPSLPSGVVTVRLQFDDLTSNDITVRLQ